MTLLRSFFRHTSLRLLKIHKVFPSSLALSGEKILVKNVFSGSIKV